MNQNPEYIIAMMENYSRDASVISLDWFSLSMKTLSPYRDGDKFQLPPSWQCIEMTATATWLKRWYIMDVEGNKLATFLAIPRLKKIDQCSALLEIANQVLYNVRFKEIVDALLLIYPMVVAGVSRADLCADFQMSKERWDVVRGMETGEYYVKGLRCGVQWWTSKGGTRKPHQLSWGGMESVFHWKLYNKYKELHESTGELPSKPYIEQMWKDVGFNPKDVWRLEISITACNRVVDDSGNVIPMYGWWDDRVRLYQRIYSDKFVIRQNQGHADRRSDPEIAFLAIQGNQSKFLRHRKPRSEMDSDIERRIVCRMWRDFTDIEVASRPSLRLPIQAFLVDMLQDERNVSAIATRYSLTCDEVIAMVSAVD